MYKKILVIDDEKTVGMLLKFNLKQSGYDVFTAVNSKQGIETAEHNTIDLFILDVSMPGMNGIEICSYFRNIKKYNETPIIMISSHTEKNTREAAKNAGATEYITKPFSFEDLQKIIKNYLPE